MPFLICTFASKRSQPEKIRRWIAHLDELQKVYGGAADRLQTIAVLRSRAVCWLEPNNG